MTYVAKSLPKTSRHRRQRPVSGADAVKFLRRVNIYARGRTSKFPSLLLLYELTGHDMSDTSRVALTAHVDGLSRPTRSSKPRPRPRTCPHRPPR